MSATARRVLCAQKRREQTNESDRYIDLRLDVGSIDGTESILSVGGKWDRKVKRYVENGTTAKVVKLHPGQLEAGRWFVAWLKAHLAKAVITEHGHVMRSLLLAGGRRGGKSDLAIKLAIAYAICVPRSRVWIVSPNFPKTEEVELSLLEFLPRKWYRHLGSPWYRFALANGSTITLRSAHNPEDLRRGRADFVVMNEAQDMAERCYAIVRPQTADKGGLVVLCANPPEFPIGQWVADFAEETQARQRPAKYIHIDARLNPFVDQASLDDMAKEVDERTYRKERLGEFLARLDIAFHAWSPLNSRPVPELARDVTREFCLKRFGRDGYDYIAGFDFQKHPHMAVVFFKAFADPDDPGGEPLLWAVDAFTVRGNEDELLDELERAHYVGENVACVIDASGEWQDSDRTKGRGSADVMRRRKWGHIFLPDPRARRNPEITERVAVTNARLCLANKKRHVFVLPDLADLILALRKWEMRNGVPFRGSKFAHLCDAFSYPLFRLYPRRHREAFQFEQVKRPKRGGWEEIR
jgi:hypothetical protein